VKEILATMQFNKVILGAGVLAMAAGLSACSSSKTSTTTTSSPHAVTTTTLTPLQKVEHSPAATLSKGSADVSMSVAGKDVKAKVAGISVSFTTLNLTVAGPFSFASKYGTVKLNMTGAGTISPASLLKGPVTTLFVGGDIYIEPTTGSLIATLASGKKYIQLTPTVLGGLLSISPTEVSQIVSNPAGLLDILTTPDMTVTDMGSSTVGGGSTEYKVVVDLAQAAAAPGPYQPLFKALDSSGTASQDTLYVYLNSTGEIVHLSTTITIPAKAGASPIPPISLGVAFSNFGVSVPPVTAPPASEYATA
jgi:hypothetical protein